MSDQRECARNHKSLLRMQFPLCINPLFWAWEPPRHLSWNCSFFISPWVVYLLLYWGLGIYTEEQKNKAVENLHCSSAVSQAIPNPHENHDTTKSRIGWMQPARDQLVILQHSEELIQDSHDLTRSMESKSFSTSNNKHVDHAKAWRVKEYWYCQLWHSVVQYSWTESVISQSSIAFSVGHLNSIQEKESNMWGTIF